MKSKIFVSFLIAMMILMSVGYIPAMAGAYETDFRTSITYQNIGSAATTTLSILFYETPDDTTPINIARNQLNRWAADSVAIGQLSQLPSNFEGTAVMAADQPLAATLVQNPQGGGVTIQPLSNGFSAGTPQSLLATVIKNASGVNTRFAVQNAGTAATTVTIKFIRSSDAGLQHTITQALQPGAGLHIDAGTLTQLGASFNGSVVIETQGGTGSIVSSAMELDFGTGVGAKAFEGVGQGSQNVFMPSAACRNSGMNSAYAVQNTSLTTSTSVTVEYQPGGQSHTKTIGPGAKQSFISCDVLPNGYLGAARVTSTATNVIAVGKISGNGAATAYVGVPQGGTRFALPYVRWGDATQYATQKLPRTNLTIQNTGNVAIPAGAVTVTYYDRTGTAVGTPHTNPAPIAPYAKFNSNAGLAGLTSFGCYNNCSQFGGAAVVQVTGAFQVAVVARNSLKIGTTFPSEDYNGIAIP